MAEFNGKQGVWRTVGGRRIFIADGEDLKTAMEKSGKFKNLKKDNKEEKDYGKEYDEKHKDIKDKLVGVGKQEYDAKRRLYEKTQGQYDDIDKFLDDKVFNKEQQLNDIGNKQLKGLNKKLDSDYISYIASTTNSTNDKYGYGFNEMLNEADRKGLKIKNIDIGNNGKNNASIEFENGGKIDFYNLKEGKGLISNASTDDFEKYQSIMNTYRVAKNEDVSYDFNNGRWINNNENTKIPGLDNSKYNRKYLNEKKDIQNNVKFKDIKEDMIKRQGVTSKEYQRAEDNVAQLKKERDALLNEEIELQKDWDMSEEPDMYLEDTAYARMQKEDELYEAQKKYDNLMKKDGYMERKYKMPNNFKKEEDVSREEYQSTKDKLDLEKRMNTTKKSYDEYYKKEGLGKPSNYKEGDKIEFDNGYYETIKGSIVREATDDEKRYNINSNLKGYIIRDENGFEHIVADTRIKNRNNSIDEEYLQYIREHPHSIMDIDTFKRNIEHFKRKK